MRSNSSPEVFVVELDVEPTSCPSDVHESAHDRGWDCYAQTAVAFATNYDIEAKQAFDRQHGLGNSTRHDQSLQSFVSDK